MRRAPVQVTVTNLGRHRTEAGAVGVGFIPRSSASAPAVAALAPLPAGESRRITVYVTPEKPGDLRLFAGAHAGKSNNPRGHAVLHVVAGPAGFAWWWIPLAIAGLAVAALITLRIARRRA